MNRRQATLCLFALASGIAPVVFARSSALPAAPLRTLHKLGQGIVDTRRIGRTYLASGSVEAIELLAWFNQIVSASRDVETQMCNAITDDLEANRLVRVDGWYLSLTQARIAALNVVLL